MAAELLRFIGRLWSRRTRPGYGSNVSPMRPRVAPIPRPEGLDRYEGMWVAVIDGEVADAAHTSHQLALQLHKMDHRRRERVVIEYVRPTGDAYIVGGVVG